MRALLILLALQLMPTGASSQTLTPFKFGVSSPTISVFHAYMAEAHKVYEKHGLKVDIVSTEGGSRGIQVLLSGELQATSVGLAPTIQANLKGADLRVIASTANTIPMTFFAQPRLKGPQDLKGAHFGISTFGSETDIAVSVALRKWGLKREEVTISQLGGSTQRYNALISGRVDIVPLLEPTIALARQKGYSVILDLAAERTPWVFDGILVTAQGLKTHADAIERFLKATLEATWLGFADEAKARQVITTRWRTKDEAVIAATYADFRQLMPPDATPAPDGIRNAFEQLEALGTRLPSRNAADHLDLTLLDKIKKAGFIEELKKQYPVR